MLMVVKTKMKTDMLGCSDQCEVEMERWRIGMQNSFYTVGHVKPTLSFTLVQIRGDLYQQRSCKTFKNTVKNPNNTSCFTFSSGPDQSLYGADSGPGALCLTTLDYTHDVDRMGKGSTQESRQKITDFSC